MHKKQIVTKRKYFVPNNIMHPWYSSASLLLGGGFNNFSMLSGIWRLFVMHACFMIAATSLVRPLHISHLGDSGMSKLKSDSSKLCVCTLRIEQPEMIELTTKSIGKFLEWRCTVATDDDPAWGMQCRISSYTKSVAEIDCTFRLLYAIYHRRIQWPIWGQHMSLTQTRDPRGRAELNVYGMMSGSTVRILKMRSNRVLFRLFTILVRQQTHQNTSEKQPKWTALSCVQTDPISNRWWCHRLQRQTEKTFRQHFSNIPCRTPNSIRTSMYCPIHRAYYIPRRCILFFPLMHFVAALPFINLIFIFVGFRFESRPRNVNVRI